MSQKPGIPPQFLEILRCPACRGRLEEVENGLRCVETTRCGRVYPVRDGIPHLVVDEAKRPAGPS